MFVLVFVNFRFPLVKTLYDIKVNLRLYMAQELKYIIYTPKLPTLNSG